IAVGSVPKLFKAFPLAEPDEYLVVDDYSEIPDRVDDLVSKHAVIVPHGSFVEYVGPRVFEDLQAPTFGNRRVLEWESDREKERQWLESAGIGMPALIERPEDIDRPVLVKYHGAKGGRGFFIAKDFHDFKVGIDHKQPFTIQEYILGTRYYIHFFFSPIKEEGYRLSTGSLEILGMDRRDESNIDEMYKLGAQEALKKLGIFPTFIVTGNVPVVLRESLLPKAFDIGEATIERSIELFGGMVGPFCLETIITDELEIKVFEISSRIVAGTNLFVSGSPYSDYIEADMSTGRRIARELKMALELEKLPEVTS
ncbi:MAG: formate--phosphoribosylaminoimidazolecarboxamide ligase, partial [Candidatus Thermoplasmatota archaeon]|nr:formate--phosphoribosylaminoimidazolecarboxamide ligase [Candidatus Thermoplasmatota archaeon]